MVKNSRAYTGGDFISGAYFVANSESTTPSYTNSNLCKRQLTQSSNKVEKTTKNVFKDDFGRCSNQFSKNQKAEVFVEKSTGRTGFKEEIKYKSSMNFDDKLGGCSSKYHNQVKLKKLAFPSQSGARAALPKSNSYGNSTSKNHGTPACTNTNIRKRQLTQTSNEVEKITKNVFKDDFGRCSNQFSKNQKAEVFVEKSTGRTGFKEEIKYKSSMNFDDKLGGCSSESHTQVKFKKVALPSQSGGKAALPKSNSYGNSTRKNYGSAYTGNDYDDDVDHDGVSTGDYNDEFDYGDEADLAYTDNDYDDDVEVDYGYSDDDYDDDVEMDYGYTNVDHDDVDDDGGLAYDELYDHVDEAGVSAGDYNDEFDYGDEAGLAYTDDDYDDDVEVDHGYTNDDHDDVDHDGGLAYDEFYDRGDETGVSSGGYNDEFDYGDEAGLAYTGDDYDDDVEGDYGYSDDYYDDDVEVDYGYSDDDHDDDVEVDYDYSDDD